MTTETMTRARFLDYAAPGANCSRGAPMGRGELPPAVIADRGRCPGETRTGPTREALAAIPRRFYLRALELDSGGYDAGGAYWGHAFDGSTLYAAVALPDLVELEGEGIELDVVRYYVRASSRDAAKRDIVARCPGARFFDGVRGPVVPSGFYSIAREWCGYASPRWVARFRGEWVGQSETLEGAESLARDHAADLAREG